MAYRVSFTPDAESDLSRLSKPIAQRVLNKLRWLAENFDAVIPEPLVGDWKGVFKLRIGDYRVLYTFDKVELSILVHFVKHRRQVYKAR